MLLSSLERQGEDWGKERREMGRKSEGEGGEQKGETRRRLGEKGGGGSVKRE